jgi:hypothetical protein
MSLTAFQALVAELGQSLGMAGMAAGDDGYIGLTIDKLDVHLQYEAEEDTVVLFCRLQEVDPDRRDVVYGMLLAANVLWQGANGATFGADPDTGRVFLADRRARTALDVDALSAWIERFVDTAGYWHARIETANAGGPLQDGDAAPAGAPAPNGLPPGMGLA